MSFSSLVRGADCCVCVCAGRRGQPLSLYFSHTLYHSIVRRVAFFFISLKDGGRGAGVVGWTLRRRNDCRTRPADTPKNDAHVQPMTGCRPFSSSFSFFFFLFIFGSCLLRFCLSETQSKGSGDHSDTIHQQTDSDSGSS